MPECIHRKALDPTGDSPGSRQRREVRMIYFPLRPAVFAGNNPSLDFRSGYLVSHAYAD